MKLFGTDGIRGVANQYPMTPEVMLQVGKAVARHFRNGAPPKVVIGKDTRVSGYLFESALTAGLAAAGATVFLVGPLPTPAVAHITRSFAADAGIMITASHNPADHNGIKLFGKDGFKLADAEELRIEADVLRRIEHVSHACEPIGKVRRIDDARGRYIEFAKSTIGSASLEGLRIVLDCANGAAYSITPVILEELGADVIRLHASPNGHNINHECGALHPEVIRKQTLAEKADIGIALDGDADRVILIDELGNEVNGDHILAIAAQQSVTSGVVVTEYTNSGFDARMRELGIPVERVENGDRQVIERMRQKGLQIGGEQSGHIIFLNHGTTGDGTIAALQILRIMKDTGKPLSQLAPGFTPRPQVTVSRNVAGRTPLDELPAVQEAIMTARKQLGDAGRVFVRYSGTEAKIRVLVEGPGDIQALADHIADAFEVRK